MIRAGLQPKALSDAGISNLLRQIRYKAQWYGANTVEADRLYPSSKTCSACGAVNRALKLERHWTCPNCGVFHDRNENAARNLLELALLAVGENVMLLDGVVSPAVIPPPVKLPRLKGEPSRGQRFTANLRWMCNHCYSFGVPSILSWNATSC